MLRPMASDVRWLGDRALVRTFDGDVGGANRAAHACRADVLALGLDLVEDAVPGARTLTVILREGADAPARLIRVLEQTRDDASTLPGREHRFAVRYGGDDGPDLDAVAAHAGLTADDVIARHSAGEYVVAFIGFSPGFPYLLGLDPALATPRLDSPRVRVSSGSVGIGGPWTGIYPAATPGGWNLIGRTDVALFDPLREPVALCAPGDRVRFHPR